LLFKNNLQNIVPVQRLNASIIKNHSHILFYISSPRWIAMMTIFLNVSGATGFKKWFIAHPPNSDNDEDPPGEVTPTAIAVPALDEPIMAPPEQPHRPWLVPGWGTL
jgi:hypothetical protein